MIKQVAPSVFDEMYRNYLHQGCDVTLIDDEHFFGTELCVDGEIIARRVRPAMWKDENTPGYKKPEKEQKIQQQDTSFNIIEYLVVLAFVAFVTYLFSFLLYFLVGLTCVCFFDYDYNLGQDAWFDFILDLNFLWPILAGIYWTYVYSLKKSNPGKYNKIVGTATDVMDDICEIDRRKSTTTRHYFFWSNFGS